MCPAIAGIRSGRVSRRLPIATTRTLVPVGTGMPSPLVRSGALARGPGWCGSVPSLNAFMGVVVGRGRDHGCGGLTAGLGIEAVSCQKHIRALATLARIGDPGKRAGMLLQQSLGGQAIRSGTRDEAVVGIAAGARRRLGARPG